MGTYFKEDSDALSRVTDAKNVLFYVCFYLGSQSSWLFGFLIDIHVSALRHRANGKVVPVESLRSNEFRLLERFSIECRK